MVYTVALAAGIRDFEYDSYLRLLEARGVNLAEAPRVVDPVSGKRWLHGWGRQADAEKFMADLRQKTEDDRWKVYALTNVEPITGPLGPLEIMATRQSDGCTYSLTHASRWLILKRFPHANLAPNVYIPTWTQADFEKTHRPIWEQVAIILTGLSGQQIEELGGYRVIDRAAKTILRDAPPLVV